MAETVNLHVEYMIPELEHMRRLKLYTNPEISDIVKRRKEYEYKIARKTKEKQDFLRYINYEVKLLHDLKLRRDEHKITEKKNEIEYAITKRVVKLYNQVISYFKSDVSLWMSYINFCTQVRFGSVVTEAFKELLQIHGDKANLWRYAAKWEIDESRNVDGALNYIMTGLHRHPKCPELYQQAFWLELMAVKHKRATDLEESEEVRRERALARAEVQFKCALKAVGDNVAFIISLLDTATEFDYTKKLQMLIIEYMTTNCWRSVEMWDAMAQRELKGHHYNENEKRNRVQLCIAVYKAGVKALPTPEMWSKCIDRLVELHTNKKLNINILGVLQETFQSAFEAKVLQEKHYLTWTEILGDDRKQLEIMVMATAAIPDSVDLWLTRLRYHITHEQESQITDIAQEAISALGTRSLPIFTMIIQYYQLQNKFNETKQIFEQGFTQVPEISVPLRPLYIEWISATRNTKAAKQEYDRLALLTPYTFELHQKMIQLELGRINNCASSIRNIYKLAELQLGKDSTEVWMSHINFELTHGDPALVSELYLTAKNTLRSDLVSKFTMEYAILNA